MKMLLFQKISYRPYEYCKRTIALYEAAKKFLKDKNPEGHFPSMKDLKAEKEKLTIKRSAQKDTYSYFRDYQKELRTVCSNVDSCIYQYFLILYKVSFHLSTYSYDQ